MHLLVATGGVYDPAADAVAQEELAEDRRAAEAEQQRLGEQQQIADRTVQSRPRDEAARDVLAQSLDYRAAAVVPAADGELDFTGRLATADLARWLTIALTGRDDGTDGTPRERQQAGGGGPAEHAGTASGTRSSLPTTRSHRLLGDDRA
ncbi:hypothetical protein [Streptomyces clavuligerus]|uniref:hypothetical protein n=1 Tax=Streptomyces clavuligerus TaxID=1901 RepID=UPI00018007F1|nr:hypothetical protein [Streptomyces clavuligerus]ANW22653.1 hypothetical protein BB341_30590 [Streptomyces clavuligerus]AXU17512.1 hypothetical protein D1794_33760 [Streptomyces clavuligerus]EDY52639.1 hypothetical protein SSCG_05683 [Streptomyces clavuligerus]MBY6301045.1 hypothetical protein [Streptomyces clavuligerus]QPJ96952.1 hypothetical protein GE265_27920 [Streptomyces clavuligerus]